MEEDISSNYMCYTTAQELWDNVSQMYSDLGNQSQVFELTLKLGEIRQGDDSVTKYFNSLKRLWQDLDIFNTYEWKSVDDCNHHKKTVEDSRIYKFLAGLNIEFDEVRGRIIGRPPLPSIGEVFAEVRREESRRSVMLKKKGNGESIEISALISDAAANKAANYQRRFDDKPRVWCDFCNKPRHTRETCWKIHGKPVNWKSSKQGEKNRGFPTANEADSGPFNKEQIDQLLKLIKSNSSSGTPSVLLAQTGAAYAKLVAQKSKGMPLISISLAKLVDANASEVMANLSLEVYKAFKSMQNLLVKEQDRCCLLTKVISAEQEKTGTIQKQLDTFLYSKRQKSLKMNDKSNTDALSATGLQDSPDKLAAQNPGSTKVAKRVVPAYRRSKVRGVLLQDTTEDGDN